MMSLNWKPSLCTANWMTTSIALASFWGNGTPWKSRREKKVHWSFHPFCILDKNIQILSCVFSVRNISCVLLWQGQCEEQMAWCSLTVLPPNPGWFQPNTEYPPGSTTEKTVSHPSSAWMLKIQNRHTEVNTFTFQWRIHAADLVESCVSLTADHLWYSLYQHWKVAGGNYVTYLIILLFSRKLLYYDFFYSLIVAHLL